MTSVLDRLCGATRTDVLPGFVLSEPTLREIGEAESEFQRQFVEGTLLQYPGEPERFYQALDHIKGGKLDYSSQDFNAVMREGENPAFMLYLCLRQRHPEVNRELAVGLILATDNATGLLSAVYDLWGFVPHRPSRAKQAWKPINWKELFFALRKRGMSRTEVMGLTWPQALNELGADSDALTADQIRERHQQAVDQRLDELCARLNITPQQLCDMPPEKVIEAQRESGMKVFKVERVADLVRGYAERVKSNG